MCIHIELYKAVLQRKGLLATMHYSTKYGVGIKCRSIGLCLTDTIGFNLSLQVSHSLLHHGKAIGLAHSCQFFFRRLIDNTKTDDYGSNQHYSYQSVSIHIMMYFSDSGCEITTFFPHVKEKLQLLHNPWLAYSPFI